MKREERDVRLRNSRESKKRERHKNANFEITNIGGRRRFFWASSRSRSDGGASGATGEEEDGQEF